MSLATWLLFTGVHAGRFLLRVRCPGPLGSCSPVCTLYVLCCVCHVLGYLAPVHGCARSTRCVACAVSWATWLLVTIVHAWCVVLCVRCPGPLGSCSPLCTLGVLCCVCGVQGHLARAHRCARWACRVACALSLTTWLLFTVVHARRVVLRVRCRRPLGSCSPVCPPGVLCCACGVLGHLAPVQRCARSAEFVACAVYWATWLLFSGQCVRSACCVVCAVSWASWFLFTAVCTRTVVLRLQCPGPPFSCSSPARCVVLCVGCPVPLSSSSPSCPLGMLCYVCGALGHLAPVHRFAPSACFVAFGPSSATWLLLNGVHTHRVVLRVPCPWPFGSCSPVGVYARQVVLCVRCRGPLGSRSPVCTLGVLCCVCGVLGH